jgi:hypothetical protein
MDREWKVELMKALMQDLAIGNRFPRPGALTSGQLEASLAAATALLACWQGLATMQMVTPFPPRGREVSVQARGFRAASGPREVGDSPRKPRTIGVQKETEWT